MKRTSNFVAAVLATTTLLLWFLAPRGALDGIHSSAPDDWSFLGSGRACRLETRAGAPRSVRVNCYAHDGALYVHSHRFSKSWRPFGESWPDLVRRTGIVRIQLDGKLYTLAALEITEEEQRRAVLVPRGHDPPPEGIVLFRFEELDDARRDGQR